jgi:RNA polymerase sigma-70 factor (ECF subfamily)
VDFRRWLFRVATNGVLAQFRKAGRRQAILEAAAREGRFDRGMRQHRDTSDWPEIHAALLELDEREQTIVTLRFFAELSHEEIAGIVDSTPGAVRTALSRTLARLREKFASSRPASGDK